MDRFCETTTCHGVLELYTSKSAGEKLFWTGVLISASLCAGFYGYKVVAAYAAAPVVTDFSVVKVNSLEVPDVAMCLENSLDVAKMQAEGLSSALVNVVMTYFFVSPWLPLKAEKKSNDQLMVEFEEFLLKAQLKDIRSFLRRYAYGPESFIHLIQEARVTDVNMTEFYKSAMTVYHESFGLCYIYSGGFLSSYPRLGHGLNIILKSTPNPHRSVTDGFRIELGKPLKRPNYESIKIPPGYSVDIRIEMVKVDRIQQLHFPKTLNYCDQSAVLSTSNDCFYLLYAQHMLNNCGCVTWAYAAYTNNQSEVICSPMGQIACFRRLEYDSWMAKVRQLQQLCLPPCHEIIFKSYVTYGSLNSAVLREIHNIITPSELSYVRIAYSSMEFTSISYHESISFDTLISNIGGQAGLWLGCSIITLVHFVYTCLSRLAQSISAACESTKLARVKRQRKSLRCNQLLVDSSGQNNKR